MELVILLNTFKKETFHFEVIKDTQEVAKSKQVLSYCFLLQLHLIYFISFSTL